MAAINVHQAKDGTMTYRVRVRRRGQPTQTASFSTLKAARQWATMIEGDIIAGRHFPNKKPKHTLNELLDRYVQEIMPRKTLETQRCHRPVVTFWRQKLGHKLLSYMQRMILTLFGEFTGDPPKQSVLLPDHASVRPPLPSLRETVSAQPTLSFMEKLCHLSGTKQRKPAERRVLL